MAFTWTPPKHVDGNYCIEPEQMRLWEQGEIRESHGRGRCLMDIAGRCVAMHILNRHPQARTCLIFCGKGNNGGDGLAAAHYLRNCEIDVHLFVFSSSVVKSNDAKAMLGRVKDLSRVILQESADASQILAWQKTRDLVVIDAIFGTGYRPSHSVLMTRIYQCIAELDCPVISVDIPSGICASTGYRGLAGDETPPRALIASETITFAAPKVGHFCGEGPKHTGALYCEDIGLRAWPKLGLRRVILSDSYCDAHWPLKRDVDVHKNKCGHVFVVGGTAKMPGAPRLAARAALRAGCGLATIASPADMTAQDEVMLRPLCRPDQSLDDVAVAEIYEKAQALVVGPGLGRTTLTLEILKAFTAFKGPIVIDADALWALSQQKLNFATRHLFLTPHPGEAAQLLGCPTDQVLRDLGGSAIAIAKKYTARVVLKSSVTHIAYQNQSSGEFRLALLPYPNSAMASAGMGDALAGILASMAAQREGGAFLRWHDDFGIASMAASHHARAGRAASLLHGNGLCAADLIEAIYV